MTERENVIHVLRHDGQAQWLPHWTRCFKSIVPSVLR